MKLVGGNESIASVERLRQEEQEIEIWKECKLCVKDEISMSAWSSKLNWLFKENAQLREDCLRLKAYMDMRNGEQRNSDIASMKTNRELESQRMELYQANQWADQTQRERMN